MKQLIEKAKLKQNECQKTMAAQLYQLCSHCLTNMHTLVDSFKINTELLLILNPCFFIYDLLFNVHSIHHPYDNVSINGDLDNGTEYKHFCPKFIKKMMELSTHS